MDAFAHCLEAYCVPFYHPLADGIAVEGVRLVKENLATAVKDGNNIEARAHMMAAAAMGATVVPEGARRASMRCRIRSARSTTRITG